MGTKKKRIFGNRRWGFEKRRLRHFEYHDSYKWFNVCAPPSVRWFFSLHDFDWFYYPDQPDVQENRNRVFRHARTGYKFFFLVEAYFRYSSLCRRFVNISVFPCDTIWLRFLSFLFFHSNIDRNKYNIRSDRREYYLIKLSLRFFVNPTKRDLNSFVESTLCNLKRMIDKSIINKDWLIANSVRVKNSEMILNFNKNRDIIVNYIWYF